MKSRLGLVGRYTLLSLFFILAPLLLLGVLYDRYADELLDRLTGERLKAQVAATASRLNAFFDARLYQLETISNHPSLPLFLAAPDSAFAGQMGALLRIEADVPDLYGILFFDARGRLAHVVPGQAASGPPYWAGYGWSIADLPVVVVGQTEIIGPRMPGGGTSGWLLMRQPIRDLGAGTAGSVALHIRLASVTELLGTSGVAGVVRPLLRVPGGHVLDATGRPVEDTGEFVAGPEILPGWRIELELQPGRVLGPIEQARLWLYLVALVTGAGIVFIFARLARSLRRRVGVLVHGADTLAAGDLDFRLEEGGRRDEIAVVARSFNAMADRLHELFQRMVHAEKMAVLGEFATGVAHEVRNPLATMKITVQALSRRERDGERRELLDGMASEIDRLSGVVDDLLAYGRPRDPEPRAVPVRDLLRRANALISLQARERGVHLSIQGDSRLRVRGDGDQLLQVIVNLGLNAIQACQTGGAVRFRVHRNRNGVLLEVADDGRGISPEDLPKVMEPFFTTRPRGTGLGLSITRQLVEANGGTLRIESTPGHGTTVSVSLRVAEDLENNEERRLGTGD